MKFNARLFWILLVSGFFGVLSILLIDLKGLIALLPVREGVEIPEFTPAMYLLSLVQPTVILAIAVFAGVLLSPKVGLRLPVAEAFANGGDKLSAFTPQIFPGIVGGIVGGSLIVLTAYLCSPYLPQDVVVLLGKFAKVLPLPTRLLYGGVTEELLLRWGFMTFLVWLGWRLFQKGVGTPKPVCFIAAIILSSLIFAAGHLPLAFMLIPQPTPALILFVIAANSVFALIAGLLFWKKGLESTILAHTIAHLVMFTASYFEAYF